MVTTRLIEKKEGPGDWVDDDEPLSEDGTDSEEEADEEGNLRDFVVPDEVAVLPFDHTQIDSAWNQMKPNSIGLCRLHEVILKYTQLSKS